MNTSDHQDGNSPAHDTDSCPSPELLLGHAEARPGRRKAQMVSRHLTGCAECRQWLDLMVVAPLGPPPAELSPVERRKDRDLLARRLGFAEKPSRLHRLLELADTLWKVKTPLLVPVGATALLLFMLIPPAPQSVAIKVEPPMAQLYAETFELQSIGLQLRGTVASDTVPEIPLHSLVEIKHLTTNPMLEAGTPITVELIGETRGREEKSDTVSGNGLVKVSLVFRLPDRYRIRLLGPDGQILTVFHCAVIPPTASS